MAAHSTRGKFILTTQMLVNLFKPDKYGRIRRKHE
jgi:hypothetical protein